MENSKKINLADYTKHSKSIGSYCISGMVVVLLGTISACAPAIIGGGAAVVGGALVKEKGLSGSLLDSQIATRIQLELYQHDADLHRQVSVTVQNGEVLLTGAVPTNEDHLTAVKLSWEPRGVTRVIDNIAVSEGAGIGLYAKDTWITTQLKGKFLFDPDIQSANFSVKTVSGNVYLMGIAQDKNELDLITDIARRTDGVQKVVSYVRLKTDGA